MGSSLAHLHGHRVAIIDPQGVVSYRELADMVARYINGVVTQVDPRSGVRPRIGALVRNSRYAAVLCLGALASDSRVILLNTDMGPRHVAEVIEREQIDVVVYDGEFADRFEQVDPTVTRLIAAHEGDSPSNAFDAHIASASTTPPFAEKGGSLVLLTSGTTGAPRGAERGEVSIKPSMLGGYLAKIPLRGTDRTLIAAPLFHGWGQINLLNMLTLGGTVVLAGRFDAQRTVDMIKRQHVNVLIAVPTMIRRILALPEDQVARLGGGQLRILGTGGAKIDPATVQAVFDRIGPILHNLYGTSECSYITIATPDELVDAPTTAGSPPLGNRVEILDEAGNTLPTGTVGRIFADTGLQIRKYTDGSEKEWVRGMMSTGDTGRFDERGRLFIEGRSDGMIVSGGENVFPEEVEECLLQHAEIDDAVVTAVSDADFGQRLRAYVVPGEQSSLDAEMVKSYIAAELSRSRVPRDVVLIADLPRTPAGKVMRATLDALDAEAAKVADAPKKRPARRRSATSPS
ncbi:AMP-binding protein [Nocardia sp. NPDC057272]|uniref:AMP-binding protein n=1 Tax=Nocardia sp. NPDC057272 TaxID=3346079 RepID=UPI003629038A